MATLGSNLQVTFDDLRREIGRYMGWGRVPANWTADQVTDAEDILKSGLRSFYFPADERGRDFHHDWSFLKLIGQLTTTAGVSDYMLPEDYQAIDGPITYSADDEISYEVSIVSVGEILKLRQRPLANATSTWRIQSAAVAPVRNIGYDDGQRFQLLLWPNVDGVFTLKFQYDVNPNVITSTMQYPYGGAQYSECIIESCLAAAEFKLNDAHGEHNEKFRKLLAHAISLDKQANQPEFLGYNADRSDTKYRPMGGTNWRDERVGYVTVNGTRY